MTCRTWENRCKRSSAASPGKVRIEGGNEAKRSTVELRSLAVGFCGRIKGCPEFMRSKGRPSILRSDDQSALMSVWNLSKFMDATRAGSFCLHQVIAEFKMKFNRAAACTHGPLQRPTPFPTKVHDDTMLPPGILTDVNLTEVLCVV